MMNIDELYLRDWIGLSFISQEPPVFDGQDYGFLQISP